MRRLRRRSTVSVSNRLTVLLLAATLGVTACETLPWRARGLVPAKTDQLVLENGMMVHHGFGFTAPWPRGFHEFGAGQRKVDSAAFADHPRTAWSLRNDSTRDLLDITVLDTGSLGSDEQAFRGFVENHQAAVKQIRRVILADTLRWERGAHEYIEQTRDTVARITQMLHCLASADTRKEPIVVCFNAHGPHPDQTLAPTLGGLRLLTSR